MFDDAVKFAHLRNISSDGTISNHGGLTIAYLQTGPNTYRVGLSKCHSHDNFNKAVGRAKAQGRMRSDKQSFNVTADSKSDLITIASAAPVLLNMD